jgi:NADPH-dependent curcumin reductase
MPESVNRQIVLKSRPTGEPTVDNFALVETPIPAVAEGQVLCRTIYLSLDPYMRGRMSARASYTAPVEVGQVMLGGTVSQVLESRDPAFAPGDFVLGYDGWQEYGVPAGSGLRKLDPAQARISYALGVLGMPGMTAYVALLDIGRPVPGQTVVVSAASGAVGSVVGQIARIKGCRAVGLAGSDEKCAFVTRELGFDACINYKTRDLDAALEETCPSGIDVYFDLVAGHILEAALRHINVGARIPLVGTISQYSPGTPPAGPDPRVLLTKRALMHGFLVFDHDARLPAFLADVGRWLREGRMTYREDIVDGLERAPQAFLGLFSGRNFGKLLVRVSADPTLPTGGEDVAAR